MLVSLNITAKEFYAYFRSSLGYFLILVYLIISMLSGFFGGYFFAVNNNSLSSFFMFQPDAFTMIIPAITMKLWADEYKTGTLEILLTQPVSPWTIVWGKFLASWLFCIVLLLCTLPLWFSTSFLIETDTFNIIINYVACVCLCGAICAIGCAISSFCRNPISAYIITLATIFIIRIANLDAILNMLGFSNELLLKMLKSLNFDAHYQNLVSGHFSPDDILYFVFLISISMIMNMAAIEYKKK